MIQKPAGDTLIEVMIAFAILSSVIGISFSGAMAGYKSTLAAQDRTQATLLAQYQADGLKTYRDSLEWNDETGGLPSFLNGSSGVGGELPAMIDSNKNKNFCMVVLDATNWVVQQNADSPTGSCRDQASALAPNMEALTTQIDLSGVPAGAAGGVVVEQTATVTVSWLPRNSSTREAVVNTLILTKTR